MDKERIYVNTYLGVIYSVCGNSCIDVLDIKDLTSIKRFDEVTGIKFI